MGFACGAMAKDFRRTGSHVPFTTCLVCLSRLILVVIILSSVSPV